MPSFLNILIFCKFSTKRFFHELAIFFIAYVFADSSLGFLGLLVVAFFALLPRITRLLGRRSEGYFRALIANTIEQRQKALARDAATAPRDLLTLLLVALAVLALLGMAVIVFVMWRYRIPPSGLIAMIGALVYLASPIDVLPEAMLGPLGLLDDAGIATAVVVFVYKLVTVKRRLQDAGVKGRRRPDLLE